MSKRAKWTVAGLTTLAMLIVLFSVSALIGQAVDSTRLYFPSVFRKYVPPPPPDNVLTILHTNDPHGRLQADSGGQWWGYARIATVVEEVRSEAEHVLLLDAGDVLHGTNIVNLFQGKSVIDVMNAMGYDAWALGNHDFNYGQTVLLTRTTEAQFPALAANVVETATGELAPFATAYVVKQVGGLKVAIFGLSTPDTVWATHPNNVVGLEFLDPIAVATELVPELREQADVVIALTHLGYEQDLELAEQVDGIDLIIGGHSHTRIDTPELVNGTIIAQAYEYGKVVGRVDLLFHGKQLVGYQGWLIPVTASVAEDAAIKAIVDDYAAQLAAELSQEIGETLVHLDGERPNVRTRETNLGNLITDAMREAMNADVAFTNGGGIRASIVTGTITLGDVYTVLPFDNFLVSIDLTGAQLLAALEHGFRSYPAQLGGFPHLSGMRVAFDPAQPAGSRVVMAEVNGVALDPAATYTVATNDFMAAGGDDYTMFTTGTNYTDSGLYLRDVVADYIRTNSPVNPTIEGRITTVTAPAPSFIWRLAENALP